jgi:hypothetical protein
MTNQSFKNISAQRITPVRFLIALLIFSPLFYSEDGDPLRYIKVGLISLLFLMLATPNFDVLSFWRRSRTGSVLFMLFAILAQPLFSSDISAIFNIKYVIYMLLALMPLICISSFRQPPTPKDIHFIDRALYCLFALTSASLLFSAITGIGEVYGHGDFLDSRSFAWLGDSFSPVMVFFAFYFILTKRHLSAILAIFCTIQIMQGKTAIGMLILGPIVYLSIMGRWFSKIVAGIIILCLILSLPELSNQLPEHISNFNHSLNNRLLSFNAGIELFHSSPWLGIGINQSPNLLGSRFNYLRDFLIESQIPFYDFLTIHNTFLRILAELGIVGFTTMLWFCITLIYTSIRVLKMADKEFAKSQRAIATSCALWLICFVTFYQTTDWFQPGHPQLAWLFSFYGLMIYFRDVRVAELHTTKRT